MLAGQRKSVDRLKNIFLGRSGAAEQHVASLGSNAEPRALGGMKAFVI
jgi:hypothetical protein